MIPVLVDSWLTEICFEASQEEIWSKVDALTRVCGDLNRLYPIEILRFIDAETYANFQQMISKYRGGDRRALRMFIHHFVLDNDLNNGLPVLNEPCPDDLSESWLRVLCDRGNTDTPPHWRSPMILVPEIRRHEWPGDEITYTVNGLPKTRSLVVVESYHDHSRFEPDIDPWRLGCVGEPRPDAPLHERKVTFKRLPRPPLLPLHLPLAQLSDCVRDIGNCNCGIPTSYYFLPPATWNPISKSRTDWRKNSFERDGVVLKRGGKRETGYRDRNNNIWVWDEGEPNHWDVKTTNDIRIAKVRYDGLLLPS